MRSLENAQVFYTYEWALAVQRAYRGIMGPLLFLAYEGKSLVGIVALASDQANVVSFLCATTGDYCDFLSTPENKPAFVAAVFAELKISPQERAEKLGLEQFVKLTKLLAA